MVRAILEMKLEIIEEFDEIDRNKKHNIHIPNANREINGAIERRNNLLGEK